MPSGNIDVPDSTQVWPAQLVQVHARNCHRITFLSPKKKVVFANLLNAPMVQFQPGRQPITVRGFQGASNMVTYARRIPNTESGAVRPAMILRGVAAISDSTNVAYAPALPELPPPPPPPVVIGVQ